MKEFKEWLQIGQVDVAFPWTPLREGGYTESLCGRWSVSKVDGRTIKDVEPLDNFAWIGGLVWLNAPETDDE